MHFQPAMQPGTRPGPLAACVGVITNGFQSVEKSSVHSLATETSHPQAHQKELDHFLIYVPSPSIPCWGGGGLSLLQ